MTLTPSPAKAALAIQLHHQGRTTEQIMVNTGLSAEQIRAAVGTDNAERSQRPHTAAETSATPPERLTTRALLEWAERHEQARVRKAAARIVALVTELREAHAAVAVKAAAEADVERLAAELAAAKHRLRHLPGRKPNERAAGSKPDAERKARLDATRAWLNAQGHSVAALGRVPAHLQALYDAAHPGETP